MSPALSATPARSVLLSSVACPGLGLEGMVLGSAAEDGTVVPSFAMSKRSPPLLGPCCEDMMDAM